MRRASAPLAALALALAAAAGAAPDEGASILAAQPREIVDALYERHVILLPSNGSNAVARALVLFERPVERVFSLLSQTSRQREYRPELAHIETIEALPDGSVDEHRMRILFLDIRYRLRHRVDREGRRLSWKLAPGFEHDVERIEGSWKLYPLDSDQTLGVFRTRVEVGPALPARLQDYATRRNLPRTLERCRRWVDGDGRIDD